jgi:hypothetical protein
MFVFAFQIFWIYRMTSLMYKRSKKFIQEKLKKWSICTFLNNTDALVPVLLLSLKENHAEELFYSYIAMHYITIATSYCNIYRLTVCYIKFA